MSDLCVEITKLQISARLRYLHKFLLELHIYKKERKY